MQIILFLSAPQHLIFFTCIPGYMSNLFGLFILFLRMLAYRSVTACISRRGGSLSGGRALYVVTGLMLAEVFMCFLGFGIRPRENLRNLCVGFFGGCVSLASGLVLWP